MHGAPMRIDEKPPSHWHLRAPEGQTRADPADTLPPNGRMRSAVPVGPAGSARTILTLDLNNRI